MTAAATGLEGARQYLEAFDRLEHGPGSGGASWPGAIRREALERFAERGFPTTREEAWRCTSVAPIAKTAFAFDEPARPGALTPELFERLTFEPWDCTHLVFMNGRFAPDLSIDGSLPKGVRLTNLAEALRTDRARVEPHLARHADYRQHAFTALNTAFMRDGVFLHVPRGAAVKAPIHLLYVSTSNGRPAVSHPRNLFVFEEGGQATIVESYAGIGPDVYFTNAVTEIVVGDGAVVDHTKLQRESAAAFHVAALDARLGRDARFASHAVALGGALSRHEVTVRFDGEGGECTLNGLYVLDGSQHADNHTTIDHARPHCTSRELYKGVLDDRSRGVFDGTIIVRPDAQKSDARQVNRNLLLSEEALADSKPTLLISADDVKCSHAATIGQLQEDALFYLRSRGLGQETARRLLVHAFASDIVGRIRIEAVRAGLDCLLFTRLPRHHGARGPS